MISRSAIPKSSQNTLSTCSTCPQTGLMLWRFRVSSINFTSIGTGKFLATLRSDLKKATGELLIICPWLDEFFALEIAKIGLSSLNVRILMRPQKSVDPAMWPHMQTAIGIFRGHFPSSTVRTPTGSTQNASSWTDASATSAAQIITGIAETSCEKSAFGDRSTKWVPCSLKSGGPLGGRCLV